MEAKLKEFVENGNLGFLNLGMRKLEIKQKLGKPEDWEIGKNDYQKSNIWKYGDIELHFKEDKLEMIFIDNFDNLTGGKKIKLDCWIINGKLTYQKAHEHFLSSSIPFSTQLDFYNENGISLVSSCNTILAFSGDTEELIYLRSVFRKLFCL